MLTVRTSGPPRERGRLYGNASRSLIRTGIDAWFDALEFEFPRDREPYLTEFLERTSFVDSIRTWTPWVLEEIEGIAEGAGLSLETVFAYNLPDEEWCYRQSIGVEGMPFGCSVIGLRRAVAGVPVAAQNMDMPAHYEGTQV